jgi:lysozyme family protein
VTIDDLLSDVLTREGWPKVTEYPSDPGGLTRGGVTIASYNAWRAKQRLHALTREQFVRITEQEARDFFYDEFVRPFIFIGEEAIFAFLGDWAVNAGVDDPTKALQTELKRLGHDPGAIDGVPGPKTRAAWDQVARDPVACREIKAALIRARIEFHVTRDMDAAVDAFLKTHKTTRLHALHGHLRRTASFID